jgi:hypothetical protein
MKSWKIAAFAISIPAACMALAAVRTGAGHFDRSWNSPTSSPLAWRINPRSYWIVKDPSFSDQWTCRGYQASLGKPISSARLSSFELAKLKLGTSYEPASSPAKSTFDPAIGTAERIHSAPTLGPGRSYISEWAAVALKKSDSYQVGSVSAITEIRHYPSDDSQVVEAITKEFGAPLSIIQTSGTGCRLGRTTMIYSADPILADGRKINTGIMCKVPPPGCRLEETNPCADPKRLPNSAFMTVSIDRHGPGLMAQRLFKTTFGQKAESTAATLVLSERMIPEKSLSAVRDMPSCKRDNDPFLN